MELSCWQLPTSIADDSDGRRGEDEYPLLQQGQLPEDKDVRSKILEVLWDGSNWVGFLGGGREGGRERERVE